MYCLALLLASVSLVGAQTPQETAFTDFFKAMEADDINKVQGFFDSNPTVYSVYCDKSELEKKNWDTTQCVTAATGSDVGNTMKAQMAMFKYKMTISRKWSGKKDGQPSFMAMGKAELTGKGSPIPSSVKCTSHFFYATKWTNANKMSVVWEFSDPKNNDDCHDQITKAMGGSSSSQSGSGGIPGYKPIAANQLPTSSPTQPPAALVSAQTYLNAFKTLNPDTVGKTVADNIQPTYVLQGLYTGAASKDQFMSGLTPYLTLKYVEFDWKSLDIWPTDDPNFVWIRLFPVGYLAGAPSNGTNNYRNHYFMGFHIDSNKLIDQELIVYNTYVAERSEEILEKYQCLSCDLKASLSFVTDSPCGTWQKLATCYGAYTKLKGSPCMADLNNIKDSAKTAGCTLM